jgi:hypothetical protein
MPGGVDILVRPSKPSEDPIMRFAAAALLVALLSFSAFAADKEVTYIDPKEAAKDPDFALQGEYAGSIQDNKFGVQLIALGNGKFHGVGYPGGLPGDGWDGERKVEGDGQRGDDGAIHLTGPDGQKGTFK